MPLDRYCSTVAKFVNQKEIFHRTNFAFYTVIHSSIDIVFIKFWQILLGFLNAFSLSQMPIYVSLVFFISVAFYFQMKPVASSLLENSVFQVRIGFVIKL